MRKLLTLIAAMIMCNAYGEGVIWYTDGNVSVNGCTINGNITTPPIPQKEGGFRFIGWKEGTDEFLAINGTSYSPQSGKTASVWTATFPYGTVSGEWSCNVVSGSHDDNWTNSSTTSNLSTNTGAYCWCKLTNAGPLSDVINVSSSRWVYKDNYNNYSNCRSYCPYGCGIATHSMAGFRKTVFGL